MPKDQHVLKILEQLPESTPAKPVIKSTVKAEEPAAGTSLTHTQETMIPIIQSIIQFHEEDTMDGSQTEVYCAMPQLLIMQ